MATNDVFAICCKLQTMTIECRIHSVMDINNNSQFTIHILNKINQNASSFNFCVLDPFVYWCHVLAYAYIHPIQKFNRYKMNVNQSENKKKINENMK